MIKVALIWLTSAVLLHASMGEKIRAMITKHDIKSEQISVMIRSAKTGNILASINADQVRKPASVMKILTTYSALLELGFGFRWPTKFYYHGSYKKGVIQGDLIIKAYGDPTLSDKDIPKIVKRLRAVGVKSVTGNIVIDRSFFDVGERITSGFDAHRFSEYNAMPDAMMFNDHLSAIVVKPKGKKIIAYKSTQDRSYEVINNIKPSSKTCVGNRSWPRILINTESTLPRVTLSGTMSLKCRPRIIKKLVTHSYKSFYYALKAEMRLRGIAFGGNLHLSKTPSGARALFTHYAKPLTGIVAKTNKKSNNLYARHLMLLLGAKLYGAPATEKKGRKAVEAVLEKAGLSSWRYTYLDNGCGLSRTSRITAKVLSNILHNANRKHGTQWRKTLSIAGVDGTIRKRFRKTVAKGRAWMKTGTLKDAKNIAGYVRSKGSKRLYSVVILYNGREKWKGSALQNQIINWLAK
ncbi:MAG: D-alanyl-D-alanine carboxypeptidase/D-alanyl-D-alanine-endopeptidase [Sulfurovum sp.]|nr:D-alanyl-D-alanine carboxypeptidase/D-alanyl-D-alanine-endopeptidase [Sulfurovum sp.]